MGEPDSNASDLTLLRQVALEAGKIGMKYFKSENEVWYKGGNSPVSQADREIDDYLRETIQKYRPDYGWLSEETDDNSDRLSCKRLIIVDPIDGTRGFINDNPQWCISIAVVEDDRPIDALLHCPALNQTFSASKGEGFSFSTIAQSDSTPDPRPIVTGSKKLIEIINDLKDRPFRTMPFVPSLAYRLALVAADGLDGAFARPGASEWDVAAADLLLEEAGCLLTDPQGNPIRYNQKNVRLPGLVAAKKSDHEKFLSLANSTGIFQ